MVPIGNRDGHVSLVGKQTVCLFDREPLLRPDLNSERRRAEPRSRLAAGHRRRAAVLRAASTAPVWGRSGWPSCRGGLAGGELARLVGFALGEDGPGDASELGGDGDRSNIALLASDQALRPDQQAVLRRLLATLDHGEQALAGEHEVASDITGALLGDAAQLLLVGALPLPGHQTQRGGEGAGIAIGLRAPRVQPRGRRP